MSSTVVISRHGIIRLLCFCILLLALAGGAGLFANFGLGHSWGFGLVYAVNFITENTLPTFFNVLLLLVNGLLLLAIWKQNQYQPSRHIWVFCAAFMFFLTYDEFAGVHEMLSRTAFAGHPDWYFAIPYSFVAAVIGAFFLPTFLRMDKRVQITLLVAVLIYGVGAMDSLRRLAELAMAPEPLSQLGRNLAVMGEELMEMIALVMMCHAWLKHLGNSGGLTFLLETKSAGNSD